MVVSENSMTSSQPVQTSLNRYSSTETDILDAMEVGRKKDDDDDSSLQRECFKLMFVTAIVVTLVLTSEEVGRLVLSTQSYLRRIPLVYGLIGIAILTCPRRVLLPVAYVVPLASISLLYLVAKVGWVRAGLMWQAIMLLDCVWFLMIRYYWSNFMAALVNPHNTYSKKFVPRDLLRALRGLDREWAHRISPQDIKSLLAVIVLGMAWGTNEQITVYFLSTRCNLSFLSFALRWTCTQILLIPETLVFTHSIELIIADFVSTSAISKVFNRTPVWLLVLWLTLAIIATIVVHTVHAKLLVDFAQDPQSQSMRDRRSSSSSFTQGANLRRQQSSCSVGDVVIHPSSSINDQLPSREQRRIELRSQMRLELDENNFLDAEDQDESKCTIANQ
uniref:Transmembrane protein n=1 Tax=Aureoumbra lagunensis TaxID=44058 RepID=A0A7S3JY44_9STRA|mmetsp:Transcript_20790/g.26901  ORF Transcript_20790/g.26901 Transcript_20790/m.26901 type:complete len:390 (+) Transcript_20790:39-1208(+)